MTIDMNNLCTLLQTYLPQFAGFIGGLVGGYFLHVFKSKYDEKSNIKYWARKLELDIISAREICKEYIDMVGNSSYIPICSDKFSDLGNLEKVPYSLINKLSKSNAAKLTKFYSIIDEINSSRQNFISTSEKILGPSASGRHINMPQTNTYALLFRESIRELNDYDVNSLLDELKKYSK